MPLKTYSGPEIIAARKTLGLTQEQLGFYLGFAKGQQSRISEAENERSQLDQARSRLLEAYLSGYRPDDWPVDT